jgi:apolipoprotein N-acyltransferase
MFSAGIVAGAGRVEVLRRLTALASGLALALAFPHPGWAGLAWIAPGILFFCARQARPAAAFRMGYFAGVVHYLVSLVWLRLMPFPAGAYAAWISLSLYQALFWGAWTYGVAVWSGRGDAGAAAGWVGHLEAWAAKGWGGRMSEMVRAAAWWVGLEYLRGWLFSGFPWNFLGVTQWRNAPLLQIASVAGVYGVSFLVAWCSLALASALVLVALHRSKRMSWLAETRLPLFALLVATGAGFHRIMHWSPMDDGTVRLALVQPSLAQSLIWDPSQSGVRFAKITDLSRQALATKPDVLVWPEASLDLDVPEAFKGMRKMVGDARTPWVFGADDGDEAPDGRRRMYNAAWVIDGDGKVSAPYHKRRLVIFGEYVPLADKLPFLKSLTPIGDGFTPGTNSAPFRFGVRAPEGSTNAMRTLVAAPVICFEDIFPAATSEHVQNDTDFLLEMTNDGWFRESQAQWQHAANVAIRSVENGVPLVRCANNGLTCWFDGVGRLRDILGESGSGVYQPGFLLVDVPLAPAGGRPPTLYRLYGNWFAGFCLWGGAVSLWAAVRRGRRVKA